MTEQERERLRKQKEKIVNRRRKLRRRKKLRSLIKGTITAGLIVILATFAAKTAVTLIEQRRQEREETVPYEETSPLNFLPKESGQAAAAGQARSRYDEELIAGLEEMKDVNPMVDKILYNLDQYPEALIRLLVKDGDTLDFVLGYPAKKGTVSANIDLSEEYKKGKIPLLLQWDQRWGYGEYGDGIIGLDGCGPVCLSMVAVGVLEDVSVTPDRVAQLAEKRGYIEDGGTSWDLMTEGAKSLGLVPEELSLNENAVIETLKAGHPIICSMRKGDFTTSGHFIVLTGYEDGRIAVNDPNSRTRSEKTWDYDTLQYQIKNLWSYTAGR